MVKRAILLCVVTCVTASGWAGATAADQWSQTQVRSQSRGARQSTLQRLPLPHRFEQAVARMRLETEHLFGTQDGSTVSNLSQLAEHFDPYSTIAGTTVIWQEWQRYQPFNAANFVFTPDSLELTATIAPGGGLFAGGIHSGQLWTRATYKPGMTGSPVYAFEVDMKIAAGPGMESSSWFYAKQWDLNDGSEIDHPEFFVMDNNDEYDWTGFHHGPGVGPELYSLKHNEWAWRPGINFSANHHKYQTVWTPDTVYKYVDGTLVLAQSFVWTGRGAAQMAVTFVVGSDHPRLPGLQPTSVSQFPNSLSVRSIKVWSAASR